MKFMSLFQIPTNVFLFRFTVDNYITSKFFSLECFIEVLKYLLFQFLLNPQ